ncbi:RNA polymerase sigma-70 factor [Parabacteroides chongii]|mgnify:FL=1|jgi:RNA polymerase sigma-70 factor (ECF subfamily)|uniref:RNA polymerase sigma-70 factor n=1 Tax=Parabacteroides chongii TaxID=2685834 RepID=UPI00240D179F|nr:RNA polymerase sigma-70 factor [Parabacteroides chongii]WFE86428.1 RNA polymerase sigma-70 factor [Parabacteroides chongii]
MEKKEELHLIHSLKSGNNQAYKYIYDHHYVLLCKIAYEFLKDDFLAESIVDDIIFHLWEKRDTLEITTSLRSYLVQAVRNRCINYLNLEREKREVRFSVIDQQNEWINSVFPSDDYPLARLLENELEQEIRNAINRLPEECKVVFKKSRFEEKRYEQIAEELGISVNTVKYHIKNAISRLSADLSKYLLLLICCFWI